MLLNKVILIPNTDKIVWYENTERISDIFLKLGVEVFIDAALKSYFKNETKITFAAKDKIIDSVDLIVTLGGDGTLMRAAKTAAIHDIPILGINLGNLGYLVEMDISDGIEYYQSILDGQYNYDVRMMLNAKVRRDGDIIADTLLLNEVCISKSMSPRMIAVDVYTDGVMLSSYLGDGVIAATPTGSTAYSLSAGGPIVEPQAENIIITPICPHRTDARSIIVSPNRCISFEISETFNKEANLACDGSILCDIKKGDIVNVERSDYDVKLLRVKNRSFYDIYREKMRDGRN